MTEDNVRSRRRKVHCLDDHFDELLERLGALNKVDVVFAADHTRLINRRRPAGASVSPARERSRDSRAAYAGAPDLLAKYPALASREVA